MRPNRRQELVGQRGDVDEDARVPRVLSFLAAMVRHTQEAGLDASLDGEHVVLEFVCKLIRDACLASVVACAQQQRAVDNVGQRRPGVHSCHPGRVLTAGCPCEKGCRQPWVNTAMSRIR